MSLPSDRRVLVTGSRTWTNVAAIEQALRMLAVRLPGATLVSGACPTGADAIAEQAWNAIGLPVERHPADWDQYGKLAGFIRNTRMVALGADVCVAFIAGNSRGASMTAGLAERAGIPTHRYTSQG